MRRTAVFIFMAALLTQVAGCAAYFFSTPQPIPGVGQKIWNNALRLKLPDLELIVEAVRIDAPSPSTGRWPVDKSFGQLLILVVVDPMGDGVQFDPFQVRYKFNHVHPGGVTGTAAWALAKPAAPPSVVQTPFTSRSGQGRHGICLAEWGSYRLITGPTWVHTRTCFRLFFEGVLIASSSAFTLTIGGVSTTGKPVGVPPIKFKPCHREMGLLRIGGWSKSCRVVVFPKVGPKSANAGSGKPTSSGKPIRCKGWGC